MKTNKYLYGYRIYVNYGYGWEYEYFELTRKGVRMRENCPYPVKVTHARELNPAYVNECLEKIIGNN